MFLLKQIHLWTNVSILSNNKSLVSKSKKVNLLDIDYLGARLLTNSLQSDQNTEFKVSFNLLVEIDILH